MNITIGLYFEIRDAKLYGGVGSIGYANINFDCKVENIGTDTLKKYATAQIKEIAKLCDVSVEKVKLISRKAYEENTEDDEEYGDD